MANKIDFDPDRAFKNVLLQDKILREQELEKAKSEAKKDSAKNRVGERKENKTASGEKGSGKKKTKDFKMNITAHIPRTLFKKIKMRTVVSDNKKDRTISSIIENAVEEYLERTRDHEG